MKKFPNFSSGQELECYHDIFSKENNPINFWLKTQKII